MEIFKQENCINMLGDIIRCYMYTMYFLKVLYLELNVSIPGLFLIGLLQKFEPLYATKSNTGKIVITIVYIRLQYEVASQCHDMKCST